jgi:hypothetical protein
VAKEFIQSGLNSDGLHLASEQQKQLSYFTESNIQTSILTSEYINKWADRKYQTDDYFLNFIKSIFKDDNFLLFTKYLRYPLPSTKIVKNEIEPNLKKVLYAENATFEHEVNNVNPEDIFDLLKPDRFNKELFYYLVYRHNDILIEDTDENGAYRYFLDIDLVTSVKVIDGKITKIAFTGSALVDGVVVNGIVYIDDKVYSLYDTDYTLLIEKPHDLGRCPADFVSDIRFKNSDVIRESPFTFIREELEEYVFLKTLQKMTEPNGAFPVVTKLDTGEDNDGHDTDGSPTIEDQMSSQQAKLYGTNPPTQGDGSMQPGTIYEVPVIEKQDGSIDIDAVQNYVNFHFIPTDVLANIDTRITNIENSIVTTIIGDVVSSNEASKNESQIRMGVSTLENQLTGLAEQLTRIRTISDNNMLELQYPGRVEKVFIHYGTDFYLDSLYKMMQDFEFAPNPIERKDVLIRINQNKYKNNEGKKARQKLLYELLPYSADKDFNVAIENNVVTPNNMELQLRFNYWISKFEAQYGDIIVFFMDLDGEDNEKITLINNLLIDLIKPEVDENNSRKDEESSSSQGE